MIPLARWAALALLVALTLTAVAWVVSGVAPLEAVVLALVVGGTVSGLVELDRVTQ